MARSPEIRSGHSLLLFVLAIAASIGAAVVSAVEPRAESGAQEPWVWFLLGAAVVFAVGGIVTDAILSAATAAVHRVLEASTAAPTSDDAA